VEELRADFGGARVLGTGVGPLLEKFDDVTRIAVLRGGGLGDLLFALPAVSALKAAYPQAAVTLLGTPVHVQLVSGTLNPFEAVRVLPFAEGVRPGPEDPKALETFFADLRRERFDLAVQLHGGGRYSNPFLLGLGARHTVGTRTPDAAPLERTVPYVYYQHEPLRGLEVAGFAGAPPVDLEARLRPLERFAAAAAEFVDPLSNGLVVIHPGATDPRRRWPVGRFGEVAAAGAAAGCHVLVVGDASEGQLASEVVDRATGSGSPRNISSMAGRLDLGTLAALLARCDVMVGNDSGPRHLAQALGTPTVGVYWVGNLINAGALGRTLHRVHLSWVTRCPECGVDLTQVGWTAERCAHDDSMVAGVRADDVYEDVLALMAMSPLPHGK
jgi:ADP-heptose:LPS heptosyltransferase